MPGISWAPSPNPSPWDQVPQGIASLMQGVSAVREKVTLPQDLQTLSQMDPTTDPSKVNFPELMGKMKSQQGKTWVMDMWQNQMKQAGEVTNIYDPSKPANQQITTIRGAGAKNLKVVQDPNAKFEQQQKLQTDRLAHTEKLQQQGFAHSEQLAAFHEKLEESRDATREALADKRMDFMMKHAELVAAGSDSRAMKMEGAKAQLEYSKQVQKLNQDYRKQMGESKILTK